MSEQTTTKKHVRSGGRPVVDTERRTHVGQTIRRYRLAAGMDQADLAKRLGYTKTAIGNWELGLTRPDIDNVPKLCRVLGIPVTELLGLKQESALPVEERELLETYHRLDRFNRNTIRQMMDRLLFQQDTMEKKRLRDAYMRICRYEEAAAAGIGAPMAEYAENEMVYVARENVPSGANGIVHINGRSMEPTFRDGSDVYVCFGAPVQTGRIGIFIVNGESYIKEYRPDGLYSHNQRYKPIFTGGDTDVRCCGLVLGPVAESAVPTEALLEKIEAAYAESDDGER